MAIDLLSAGFSLPATDGYNYLLIELYRHTLFFENLFKRAQYPRLLQKAGL
jgi:hypothetical protein